MGFFKSIFGINSSSHEKLRLDDKELGIFTALNNDGTAIIWKGHAVFLGEKISLFIKGDKTRLDRSGKTSVQQILKNENSVTTEIEKSLKGQYDQADKFFTNREAHFNCIAVSNTGHGVTVTMEEKDTYHQFNIQFSGNIATGVSIDT